MPYHAGAPLRGAIVAMTRDNVIGLKGRMPWHYPADMKRFKRQTMGCNIIMGRLTWESIGCRPLPGRRNIVISKRPVKGAECYTDPDKALDLCEDQDTWIIGGGQIYSATFDWITLLDVTYVPDRVGGDKVIVFPEIDGSAWRKGDPKMRANLETVVFYRR